MILLDILLNICNANKGRLPLIEHHDLKNILVQMNEIKGTRLAEIKLMVRTPTIKVIYLSLNKFNFQTSRLQLLLTPYGLIFDDVDLAPLGINQVIKIMQNTEDNNHSPALMARCIDFLCDVLRCSPSSFKQYNKLNLLLYTQLPHV